MRLWYGRVRAAHRASALCYESRPFGRRQTDNQGRFSAAEGLSDVAGGGSPVRFANNVTMCPTREEPAGLLDAARRGDPGAGDNPLGEFRDPLGRVMGLRLDPAV